MILRTHGKYLRPDPPRPSTDHPDASQDEPLQAGDAEAELRRAIEGYKRRSGRLFPTWSEVFEVLLGLGYARAEGRVAGQSVGVWQVAITRDGPVADAVAETLARCGGEEVSCGPRCFDFRSPAARDQALDAARRAHGWTCAEPR